MAILSHRVYLGNQFELGPNSQRTLFAVLLVASFLPVPWIHLAHQLRCQRQVHATAQRLNDYAKASTAFSDLARTMDRADYKTDEAWTAWHPKQEEWKSSSFWEGLVPVIYLRTTPCPSALFTVDWRTFLAWNVPAECVRVDSNLPVHGAFDSTFRIESVHAIRGIQNWWVVHTELRSVLENEVENCG